MIGFYQRLICIRTTVAFPTTLTPILSLFQVTRRSLGPCGLCYVNYALFYNAAFARGLGPYLSYGGLSFTSHTLGLIVTSSSGSYLTLLPLDP